ncbi:polycystin cation channel [Ancylostoma ceylanicum]|uniref:Polycystin cation channel n=1 Tax=Ancylostoma ceylanicum TaxID=53326 RepID=A0A0D6L6Q4_9BILA|nr:polycystin cation channel [Ancylostoma ceylanicum]
MPADVPTVALAQCTVQTFYFSKIIGDLFVTSKSTPTDKSFTELSAIDDIWGFLEDEFLVSLYKTDAPATVDEEAMVYYNNRLLGKPRIRMLKVTNNSCTVANSFAREIIECFSNYNPTVEDKLPFGPADSEPYIWQDEEKLLTKPIYGTITLYSGGGFVLRLPVDNYGEAAELIKGVKSNRWIDRATRAIIIDFTLFNANVFYIIEEFFELFRVRLRYFVSFWNFVDIVLLSLCCAEVYLNYRRNEVAADRINDVIHNGLTDAPFDDVVETQEIFNNIAAVILFLSWIKVFNYIGVNKTMNQLAATLSRSTKDIGGFAVMFAVFFFAYAQFGYLVFGTQVIS